jgi:hypothetical protein
MEILKQTSFGDRGETTKLWLEKRVEYLCFIVPDLIRKFPAAVEPEFSLEHPTTGLSSISYYMEERKFAILQMEK